MKIIAATAVLLLTFAAATHGEDLAPGRVVAATTGDWNKDGKTDLALLLRGANEDDDLGIAIYLQDKDHGLLRLLSFAANKVVGTTDPEALYGQEPSIQARASGSIAVTSQNSSIGRDRFEQTLTIAYRSGSFIVAGFTYRSQDTLEPKNSASCDYNVLTGKVSSSKAQATQPRQIKIEDWKDEIGRTACGIEDD